MEFDVTQNRENYIGGSDIPCIMGISSFKTRYDLLLEKSGLKENDFAGNKYTYYGQRLEPRIREYINNTQKTPFVPNRTIKDDLRAHTDGFNGTCVLEIKTTSHIFESVDDYTAYLVQLLFYMDLNCVELGKLAVYERLENDYNFRPERLTVHDINIKDYKELLSEVREAIDKFRVDLNRLKENPLLSEEDFQPSEIVTLSNNVLALESRLAEYKTIEKEYNAVKQKLYEAMEKHDIKSWRTVNGVRITKVDAVPAKTKTVKEFDAKKFAADSPELYQSYVRDVEKKSAGRKGYIKITAGR